MAGRQGLKPKLGLSIKVMLSQAVVCILVGLILAPVFHRLVLVEFARLRDSALAREVSLAKVQVEQAEASISRLAYDWGNWNEAHNYLAGRNPEFARDNLAGDSHRSLEIDSIFYIRSDRSFAVGTRGSWQVGRQLTAAELYQRLPGKTLFQAAPRPVSGLLSIDGKPWIVASCPVTRDDGTGKPNGWVVITKPLDSAWFEAMSARLGLQLSQDQVRKDGFVRQELRFAALSGAPLTFSIGVPQTVFDRVEHSLQQSVLIQVMVGLFACISLVGSIRWLILNRLQRLSEDIGKISYSKASLVSDLGSDELGLVAGQVNELVVRLREGQSQLLEREQELLETNHALSQVVDGIAEINRRGRLEKVNSAFAQMLATTEEELSGQKWMDVVQPWCIDPIKAAIRAVGLNERIEVETEGRRRDGRTIHLQIVISSRSQSGRVHVFIKDISSRKVLEDQLHRQASFDSLTGLANRRTFLALVEDAIARSQDFSVVFLDLDDFKFINDSMGHKQGDTLLQTVAERLSWCVGRNDLVARMAGDEFTIHVANRMSGEDLSQLCTQILEVLDQPVVLDGREVKVSASLGIACSWQSESATELIQQADTAMYHAKGKGKNQFAFFEPGMTDAARERLEIESGLRQALEEDELMVYYQPIYHLATGELAGAEALMRWRHPSRGMMSPNKFIPVAEESGLIRPLGWWILEKACRQSLIWNRRKDLSNLFFMSVNLSARQILSPDLIPKVKGILEDTNLPPGLLKLEITESVLMQDIDYALRQLAALRELGVSLALDDFGTGYSSLSYLARLPVDTVKIDRSFIQDLGVENEPTAIVMSIAALSKALNMEVVAEGIETASQAEQLALLGGDMGQGYHYAPPLPAIDFERIILRQSLRRAS